MVQFKNNSNIIENVTVRKRKDIFSSRKQKKFDFSQYNDLSIKDIKDRFKDKNIDYEEKMFYKRLLDYRTERK